LTKKLYGFKNVFSCPVTKTVKKGFLKFLTLLCFYTREKFVDFNSLPFFIYSCLGTLSKDHVLSCALFGEIKILNFVPENEICKLVSIGARDRDFAYLQCSVEHLNQVFVTMSSDAGLPDGLISNQKSQLGKFWRALDWKLMIHFMAIRNIFTDIWDI
jgi:hypothetical protein